MCAFGQETGAIQGTVRDAETRKPLEAANVLLQGTSSGVNAGKDGAFRLLRIPAGSYLLRVSFIGYSPQTLQATVRPGETTTS